MFTRRGHILCIGFAGDLDWEATHPQVGLQRAHMGFKLRRHCGLGSCSAFTRIIVINYLNLVQQTVKLLTLINTLVQ